MKYVDPETTIRVKQDIALAKQMSSSCYYSNTAPKWAEATPTCSTDYYIPALKPSLEEYSTYTGYYAYGILIPEEFSSLLPPKVMPQLASFQTPSMSVTAEEEALFYNNQPRVTESQILIHAVQSNQDITDYKPTKPIPQTSAIFKESQIDLTSKVSSASSIQEIAGESTGSGYFSERTGAFNIATLKCKKLLDPTKDGKFQKAWLLTEITHWDAEVEKMVVLSQYSLFSVKYDFINHQVLSFRRVQLEDIRNVVTGDVRYPRTSFMPVFTNLVSSTMERVQRLRSYVAQTRYTVKKSVLKATLVKWGAASAIHNWNPWSKQVPWMTFVSHPLSPSANKIHTASDLYSSLEDHAEISATFSQNPILVENYAGLLSSLYNLCRLGFNRSRGPLSF